MCFGAIPCRPHSLCPNTCTPPCRYRHLPKNFDNIHNLEFKKDAAGNPTKVAVGMYSGAAACYRTGCFAVAVVPIASRRRMQKGKG